jgi:hypothetical protein
MRLPATPFSCARLLRRCAPRNDNGVIASEAKQSRARTALAGVAVMAAVVAASPTAAEMPKYGGTLTYMMPADAPPSFFDDRLCLRSVHGNAAALR